jgi:hypothetical protein
MELKECLVILFEITRKYHIDHRIILSGDWNCDLTGKVSPRQKKNRSIPTRMWIPP